MGSFISPLYKPLSKPQSSADVMHAKLRSGIFASLYFLDNANISEKALVYNNHCQGLTGQGGFV